MLPEQDYCSAVRKRMSHLKISPRIERFRSQRTEARELLPLVTWFALSKSLSYCKGTLFRLGQAASVLTFNNFFTFGGLTAGAAILLSSKTSRMWLHVKTSVTSLHCWLWLCQQCKLEYFSPFPSQFGVERIEKKQKKVWFHILTKIKKY